MQTTIIAVVIIAIVIIGIIGYGVTGYAYATTRVANADRTLNTVVSHENNLNTTFKNIDTEFNSLGANTTFNPLEARAVADQFVLGATRATTAVKQDDASLVTASSSLHAQSWLTLFSRTMLDKESSRIVHARTALADARSLAADYVQDGQFLEAFLDSAADLDTLAGQTSNSDLSGASATLTTMKTHVDKALQLSSAPGLPADLHALMTDFETLVADFGNLVTDAQANNDSAVSADAAKVQADSDRISSHNYDKISADIDTYYKPLVDDFNSEMAAAAA
ncbi:MAG: hypothetical protein ACREOM_00385 [Candidatus Dormibacteraceae bacterium]